MLEFGIDYFIEKHDVSTVFPLAPEHLNSNGITIEPRHEKTCLCHMRTTKTQISQSACASAQSDQRLCCSLPR